MKSTQYSLFCYKQLWGFLSKYYKEDYLQERNIVLEKANILMTSDEYIARSVMNMIILCICSIFFSAFLYSLFPSVYTLALVPVLPVLFPLYLWQYYQFLPLYRIKKRALSVDRFLPYAVNFISTMAVAGVSPVEIFRSLSDVDSYGELQVESKKIVKRIDEMGIDTLSALKYGISVSPSKKFKTFLQGVIGTIQSGNDLHVYLSNIVENYMNDDLLARKKNIEFLSILAEVFVISIVAFPLFLIIIISVMSFFSGPPNFTIDMLFLFAFGILPVAYLGFYFMVKSTSSEELFIVKQTTSLGFKQYYNRNRVLVWLIICTLSIILSFYFFILISDYLKIFNYNNYLFFDVLFITFLMVIGPIGFYAQHQALRRQEMQERLYDFFVELSNSISSGLVVFDAVKAACKGNYGKLTNEIKKMNAELSWRLSINQVFENFVERVHSGVIKRVVLTINKGLQMGGSTPKIFLAAAKEINQVNQIEEQKRASMAIYTIVILMSFFVFLAIILILHHTMFRLFIGIGQQTLQTNLEIATLRISTIEPDLFKYALFSFVFVQGIGSGLLGGFMMDGRLSSGIRYSFVLGVITVLIFKFMF